MNTSQETFTEFETALKQDITNVQRVDLLNEYAWELGRINPGKAMKLAAQALNLAEAEEYVHGTTQALRNLAQCYRLVSDFAISLEMCLKALRLSEPNSPLRAEIVNLLGAIYVHEGDYDSAISYYDECLEINEHLGNTLGATKVKNSIGDLYLRKQDYSKALAYFYECQQSDEIDDTFRGIVLYNIGEVLFHLREHEEARSYLKQAMDIGEKLKFQLMTVYCEALIGEICISEKDYERAMQHLFVALKAAEQVDSKERAYKIHQLISECYKIQENHLKALEHYERFHEIKESVFNEDKSKKIKNLQFQFESEAIRRETEIERIKNAELKEAYDQIEEQNEKIISSINYAKRIQQAILPADEKLFLTFNEHFVLYIPKDIVSGDFYWMQKVGEWVLWAAVDCTGHGVPGALMSILGANGLNKIVVEQGVLEPAEILRELTLHVISSIQKTSDGEEVKDGMDMALCAWNTETGVLKYAGAYNPLYFVREGVLREYKATRRPIGHYMLDTEPEYEQHEMQVKKGDVVFTFSDGFADQFGGKDATKYSYKRLRNRLTEISGQRMKDAREVLEKEFWTWKGDQYQIDDICVMGVRF